MTITLDQDTASMLREKASREGAEPDAVARLLLADVLEADAREYRESVAAIREALESSPGKPVEQYIAEQRVKHGLPDSWPSAKLTETEEGVIVAEW